ncbi:DedA family protein [Bacillus sp. HMF5848]|uniref:DedA family protein n=1 Tax=Bacillus sp. HMF5848 TaxID=2495421 RepID=UPI000F7798D6|nr:DedA family protein [Bacillus sp. HMF5848]RSK27732.1 DedA family protein [Bacillus sp. HMF5848]
MEKWLTDIINEFGYIGIMLLIALENIFPPIPSEVILTFSGFMIIESDLTFSGVVLASTVGSTVGAIVLYIIGLQLDVERLEKIVDKWGHVLRVTKKDIYKADAWFDKYGAWTVFFCRFIPLIRSLISLPAGMSNMNLGLFLFFTVLGTSIWNAVLVYLGASVGNSWEDIVKYMKIYSNIIYAVLFLFLCFVIIIYLKKRK